MLSPAQLGKQVPTLIFIAAMVAVIVGLDLSFFRSRSWFWERLSANIGVALVFAAFYFRFIWRS
jgi:hypothetical protein